MFGLSLGEILVLAAIALIVIGPKQLPEFARQLGKMINELKRAAGEFTDEIKQQARVDLDVKMPPPPAPPSAPPLAEKKDEPS